MKRLAAAIVSALLLLGTMQFSVFGETRGAEMKDEFIIYDGMSAVPIIMDTAYSGKQYSERSYNQISRAAQDLRRDIAMVNGGADYIQIQRTFGDYPQLPESGKVPKILNKAKAERAIIIGSLADSAIIKKIIASGKFPEAKAIEGKWEAYAVKKIENPIDGVGEALVIAGSDARGTIYGIYTLSEAVGVSPWYWFSDAGIKVKDKISVSLNEVSEGPSVKYRGIFINDEERLIDWAKLKFPTNNGTPDVNLYKKVFELLLRLKANTLWPAMHEGTTSFNIAKDNSGVPVNAKAANDYGIVMASSHCEMMLRCNVGEWWDFYNNHKNDYNWKDGGSFDYTQNKEGILGYWKERLETNKDFESILALGIRGIHDGDAETDNLSIYGNSKVNMMADVIKEQRKLIKEVYGSETAVAQVFIPYKGMADIYNGGLKDKIPDDVMLMWAEDNYGYVRQVPNAAENARSGGRGIYYHSSYWGWYNPKSYLWLNSVNISLMSHQLHRAYDCGAGDYWILNVGDIKPGDILTEYFLKTAWDIDGYNNDNIESKYLKEFATENYGLSEEAALEAAEVMNGFYKLTSIKRAEFYGHENGANYNNPYFKSSMINPLSVTAEGDEGQRVVDEANEYVRRAEEIYNNLDPIYQNAFYQQILYHLRSYRDAAEEYVYLWKNQQYAQQGRYNSAKLYAELSKTARDRIPKEQEKFWAINDNKWTKTINYNHPVSYYNMNEGVLLAHDDQYKEPVEGSGIGVYAEDGGKLRFNSLADNKSYIDIFSKSAQPQKWNIVSEDWIKLSKAQGETASEERIIVSVDWSKLTSSKTGRIKVYNDGSLAGEVSVEAAINNVTLEPNSYAEANGKVVLEAERFTESIKGADGSYWAVSESSALNSSAVTAMPFDAARLDGDNMKNGGRLRYRIYFSNTGTFSGNLYRMPTLNEGGSGSQRIGVGLDNASPTLLKGTSKTSDGAWAGNIMRGVELLPFSITVNSKGWHDFYIYRSDAAVLIDKIVIQTESGAVSSSLMGGEISPNSFGEDAPRAIGQVPSFITNSLPMEDIEINEGEEVFVELDFMPASVSVGDSRIANAALNGGKLKIRGIRGGTSAIMLLDEDSNRSFTVFVNPKKTDGAYIENEGKAVINAIDALSGGKGAEAIPSSNGTHFWKLKGIGVMCAPSASSAAKANWLATNAAEGARLSSASGNEKVTSSSAATGSAPCLKFNVYIENPGKYYLFMNSSNPNEDADSYHAAIDGVWQYHSSEGGSAVGKETWYTYSKASGFDLTKGTHSIEIFAREAGLTVNQLVLTTNKDESLTGLQSPSERRSADYTLSFCDGTATVDAGKDGNFALVFKGLTFGGDEKLSLTEGQAKNGESVSFQPAFGMNDIEEVQVFLWDSIGTMMPLTKKAGFLNRDVIKAEIKSLAATQEKEAENKISNAADGDYETVWACNSEGSITADLGEIKRIRELRVYLKKYSDDRTLPIRTEVSCDGENWEEVFDTTFTNAMNYMKSISIDKKARYIRVCTAGNSVSDWASVAEIEAYV